MPWFNYNNRGVPAQDAPDDPIPVGAITMFTDQAVTATVKANLAVDGWLLCDGASYVSATYPDLVALLVAGPPPANFTVPNFFARYPIGSDSSFALQSSDSSTPRTNHNHGGVSTNTHVHAFAGPGHQHGALHHQHSYYHYHTGDHLHGAGTFPWGLKTVQNPGSDHQVKDFVGAGASAQVAIGTADILPEHRHVISGSSALSTLDELLGGITTVPPTPDRLSAVGGPATTHFGNVSPTDPSTETITTPGQVIPPYLNMYFIIKAKDQSGLYT